MDELLKFKSESLWDIAELLAAQLNIRRDVVINLMNMVEKQECTIPFIARYRKERTNGMDAEGLRDFINLLNELRAVQKKASTMMKNIEKQGNLDSKTESALLNAQTMEELEHVYAPYKGEKKSTLANRARALGLDEAACQVISNPDVNLRRWVTKGTEGRATLSEVETGVKHILSDIISKEKITMDKVRDVFKPHGMSLESKLSASKKKEMEKDTKQEKIQKQNQNSSHSSQSDCEKYRTYHDFCCRLPSLRSYQVLAINRGEAQKHLKVKVITSQDMENKFLNWSSKHWPPSRPEDTRKLVQACVDDSYNRLIKPFVLRKARSDLTKQAQKASVDVFSRNLKKLLLTPPVRGKIVLGVDPGYKNGCKCAVISCTGNRILDTAVIHLNSKDSMGTIKHMHSKHNFEIIAIGNGTACRETENFFSDFIARNRGSNLAYCIVNENGASIYSVTPEAKEEMPDLDPNLRSAVSIARRLQDPLVELVKIEPKHLGVGMYQHDIPDSLMKGALDSVIEDCVTFVGVDLNVANVALLKRIAGLKATQAKNIIEKRNSLGAFTNRQQLLEVKGIGEKTFQQCAGFIRISHKYISKEIPEENNNEIEVSDATTSKAGKRKGAKITATKKKKAKIDWKPNPLDQTWIHPESYEIAERLLDKLELSLDSLGTPHLTKCVKRVMNDCETRKLACDLSVGVPTLKLILDGLSQDSGFRDIRSEMRNPLFRRGVNSMRDIRPGTKVSGRITNVTDFGIFVDVGVGQDGLIHLSDVGGRWEEVKQCVGPNDTVEVVVKSVDCQRKRISLRLIHADMSRTTFL